MQKAVLFVVFLTALFLCATALVPNSQPINFRPIIGILSQPTNGSSLAIYGDQYIAASYVKYVENGGGRAVPILYNSTEAQLKEIFSSINGVLFPGGDADLKNTTLFYAGNYLCNLALQANDNGDYFPIAGHCMGYELLTIITSENFDILTPTASMNISMALDFLPAAYTSRWFENAPEEIMTIFGTENVTLNNHHWALAPEVYNNDAKLNSFYTPLSTNRDKLDLEFISTFEATNYPIYGIQWHAEKPEFEWNPSEDINHCVNAVTCMQYMADFFIQEARKSTHHYPSPQIESASLIYNYPAVYTASTDPTFQQAYFF